LKYDEDLDDEPIAPTIETFTEPEKSPAEKVEERVSRDDLPFIPTSKKQSGLLQLVSRAIAPRTGAAVIVGNPHVTQITTETPTVAVPINRSLEIDNFLLADVRGEDPESIADATVRELRCLLGGFKQEKGDLMSAIDRKVDRDLVERLFNKFRSMVMGMNDRIREFAALTEKFATQGDLKAVMELLNQLPGMKETAASRVGPECLVCGRTRAQVGGTNVDEVEQPLKYVYADGGMFRKTVGSVGRIHLPALREPKVNNV
jgi:hypothetical protein